MGRQRTKEGSSLYCGSYPSSQNNACMCVHHLKREMEASKLILAWRIRLQHGRCGRELPANSFFLSLSAFCPASVNSNTKALCPLHSHPTTEPRIFWSCWCLQCPRILLLGSMGFLDFWFLLSPPRSKKK